MFKNYFKIAYRNILKHRFYSLIAILGLSVGITFTLLIGTYVWRELQVNTTLRNADNQYLVQSKWKDANMGPSFTTLAPMAKALKDNYSNLVANYYRFDLITATVSNGDKHFREEVQLGDSTMLTMYGFSLLHGDARTALDNPNSIVISSETALKYFGRHDVVGEAIMLTSFTEEKKDFVITGVLDKFARNSVTNLLDAKIPVFLSESNMQFFNRGDLENWNNRYIVNFVELQEGVQKEDLAKPIAQLLATNAPDNIRGNLEVYLTPLTTYYREANDGLVGKSITALVIIAVFILLMSIVNFVNISIGNSASRLKEIGVRKVLGGRKYQVIYQFLTESVLLTCLSLMLSLIIYHLFLPNFGDVIGRKMESLFFSGPYFLGIAVIFTIGIGLLAGIYPAFVLSAMSSVDAMKGKLKSVKENILFRRGLIISQFIIALFVTGSAIVVAQQVTYFFQKDLGYNKESILTVTAPRDWTSEGVGKMEVIRTEMERLPEIKKASISYEIPNGNAGFSNGLYKMGEDSNAAISVTILQTDEAYAGTYQIPVANGQFFHSGRGVNDDKVVINTAAANALGFDDHGQAVGQHVKFQGFDQLFTIDGVVENFHFGSMHKAISPLIFTHIRNTNQYRYLSFQLAPGELGESVAAIERKWQQLLPGTPFEFAFMDDALKQLYTSEIQLKKASQLATILSVIIVLLGILGLVSMSISKRTKELGIRKILGASVPHLILLFLKEFLSMMAIAGLVAFPVIAFVMNSWLQNYAYAIALDWQIFAVVGLVFGFFISLLVSVQSIKAALANPVDSLRSE